MKRRHSGRRRHFTDGAGLSLALVLTGIPALVHTIPSAASDCLTLGVPAGAGATGEIMDILSEAGRRGGFCVKTMRAPKNRFHALGLDGEVLTEPQMTGAPARGALATPIVTFEGALYWPAGGREPAGPGAVIGVILGQDWALSEVAARGARPYEVRDNRQLLEMMIAGRLDGMILPSISFRHFLPRFPALATLRAKRLVDLPVQVQLDPRRAAAAAALDRALAALRRDGYVDDVFRPYAP